MTTDGTTGRAAAVRGLLLGLAAGDRNGGPQRLAMRLAESLVERGRFEPLDAWRRYISWCAPQLHIVDVAEPEAAYDTGAAFSRVARAFMSGAELLAALQSASSDAALRDAVVPAVYRIALDDYRRYESAGIGAAHRNVVLALCPALTTHAAVAFAAEAEAALTQPHPDSVDTAIATAVMCRALVESAGPDGGSEKARLAAALRAAAAAVSQRAPPLEAREPSAVTVEALSRCVAEAGRVAAGESAAPPTKPTHREGHAPLVLEAALHFVIHSSTFDEALNGSLRFAGPANFCPVLVGAIGGCLWGASRYSAGDLSEANESFADSAPPTRGVEAHHLHHRESQTRGHLQRYLAVTDALAAKW
jgi:hypothetical protein